MALSIQCLVSGLEGETLSQNRAWSRDRVLEKEQQASQALWDPWQTSYLMISCPSTTGLPDGKGRERGRFTHLTLTEESDGVLYENASSGRELCVGHWNHQECWEGPRAGTTPHPRVSCREASDVAPEFLPIVLLLPCLHLWPRGGQKAERWSQVVRWISLYRLHCSLDGLISHL